MLSSYQTTFWSECYLLVPSAEQRKVGFKTFRDLPQVTQGSNSRILIVLKCEVGPFAKGGRQDSALESQVSRKILTQCYQSYSQTSRKNVE